MLRHAHFFFLQMFDSGTSSSGTSSCVTTESSTDEDTQSIPTSLGVIRTSESFMETGPQVPFYQRRANAPSLLMRPPPPPSFGFPNAYSRPSGFYRPILPETVLTPLHPLKIDAKGNDEFNSDDDNNGTDMID